MKNLYKKKKRVYRRYKNPSKKTRKKRAYARYFDTILSNHIPMPMQIVSNISEELNKETAIPRGYAKSWVELYMMRPPKIRKHFKSSRQDWRFWYYYY